MDASKFARTLRTHYMNRDAASILKLIYSFRVSDQFEPLFKHFVKLKLIEPSTRKVEAIIEASLRIVEKDIRDKNRLSIDATFYDIAAHLKKKFNDLVGDIYLESQIPSDFISEIRLTSSSADNSKLTENLVKNYKREQIRIERGRRALLEVLEASSHLPLNKANLIHALLNQLHDRVKKDYKYLSAKPYFLALEELGRKMDGDSAAQEMSEESAQEPDESDEEAPLLPFRHYHLTGEEPSLRQQIDMHLCLNRLYRFLKKQQFLETDELEQTWQQINDTLNYRGTSAVSPKEQKILRDLLKLVNSDLKAVSEKLAATFIDEYKCAEEQMRLRKILIQNELAFTEAYLNQVASSQELANQADPEKLQVAIDKLFCLRETFPISSQQQEAAMQKGFVDVERAALGISTVITPTQLTDWIKIYSIIFSNQNYLERHGQEIDFSIMRRLISNLTTFHLYDNISQLKNIVERHMSHSEAERTSQFQRFNEALKRKLMGMMGSLKDEELSLRDMIEELDFLQNKSIQFVVAETFKGFQYIVDAFNTSATDYFVRDQDAMLKESRALYSQICNESMKIIAKDTSKSRFRLESPNAAKNQKRSWLKRLFS